MMGKPPILLVSVVGGIAVVFGYHLVSGWRTGVVRFPVSVLTVEEFDRERSAANYWGVMMLDACGAAVAAAACVYGLWRTIAT
jgi:hypothetical protein